MMHVVDVDARNLFQAVADSTRVRILRLMIETKEEICLCDFVDSLLEPQYNLSKHLKVLRQSGLISAVKDGRWVYHGLIDGAQHIKNLYRLISSLPDTNGAFLADLKQFQKRKRIRGERCREDIISGQERTRKK